MCIHATLLKIYKCVYDHVNVELQFSSLCVAKNEYEFRSGSGKGNKQLANKELL